MAVSFFRLFFLQLPFNERMSESTAEVCQTQQAEDLKHQKNKKNKEKKRKKSKKGWGEDAMDEDGGREEEREKRPEEQEAKDRIETWPDSAIQKSLDHSKP